MEPVNILITESAYADLLDIENYISQDSEYMARRFLNKIFEKIDQLHFYPTSGKFIKETNNRTVRELLLNKYRIIYQIVDSENINIIQSCTWLKIIGYRNLAGMNTLIIKLSNKEKSYILKKFMKIFKICLKEGKSYDPKFVTMVLQGDEDLKAGKGAKVDIDKLF